MLYNLVFPVAARIYSRIEQAIHRKYIGRSVEHPWIRLGRDQVDGLSVDDPKRLERCKDAFEVRTALQPIKCPQNIQRGHFVARIKLNALYVITATCHPPAAHGGPWKQGLRHTPSLAWRHSRGSTAPSSKAQRFSTTRVFAFSEPSTFNLFSNRYCHDSNHQRLYRFNSPARVGG